MANESTILTLQLPQSTNLTPQTQQLYNHARSILNDVSTTDTNTTTNESIVSALFQLLTQVIKPLFSPSTANSTATELSLGAVAGALAQLFTIPVAVVTTRQQTASKSERRGLIATAKEVIDGPDGVSGLWRGLKASLVLVVNPAITYGAYERLKDTFYPGRTSLKPWEAFRKVYAASSFPLYLT